MYKDRESLTDSFWRNIGVRIDTVKEWSEAELDFRLKKALDDLKLTERINPHYLDTNNLIHPFS
jgi:hypothetical protein